MTDNQSNQPAQGNTGDTTTTILKVVLIILGVLAILILGILLGRAFSTGDYTDDPGSPDAPAIMPTPPASGQPYVVAMAYVNVRSRPGLENDIYGILPPGQAAPVVSLSQDGEWWEINIPMSFSASGTGWVSADYVVLYNPDDVGIPQPFE